MSWIDFWQALLGFVLVAFLVLGIVAGIGGWRDVRAMLQRLSQDQEPE